MAAARVARLLIRHPHAPAVVRTATVARRMVWKQAAGCDAAQETKEEQRKILSQVSKRLQTMGGTFRWAVVQAAGHMRISTIMPVTSMPSTTHIGKLMAVLKRTSGHRADTKQDQGAEADQANGARQTAKRDLQHKHLPRPDRRRHYHNARHTMTQARSPHHAGAAAP